MKPGDKVKLKQYEWNTQFVNPEFIVWLYSHKDKVFKVEKVDGNACKLVRVNFWISKDFLEVI